MNPIAELLYEEGSFGVFLLVTIILGGGRGVPGGRAIAGTWRPGGRWSATASSSAPPCGSSNFSLFGGTLLSPQLLSGRHRHLHDPRILGFRAARTAQMGHAISAGSTNRDPAALARRPP